MKIPFLIALIILSSLSSKGQAPPFHWAKDLYEGVATSIVVDDYENTYITGGFKGKVDFDPSSDTLYATSKGNYDMFISKFDFKGDLIWTKILGDIDEDISRSIKIDKFGNIYTTGWFSGEVDFDPGPSTLKLTSKGNFDVFVLKLNNDGELIWAKSMGGSTKEFGYSVRIDDSGNVITIGEYNLTADFDPGPAVFSLPGIFTLSRQLFISKLNKDGNFVWAKSIVSKDLTSTTGTVAFDIDKKGSIYISGQFNGVVDLDPGIGEVLGSSVDGSNLYILKLNSKGDYIWSKQFEGKISRSGSVGVGDLKIDKKGDINTLINFDGTIDADPGTGYVPVICSNIFLSKLDSNGNYIWGKGIEGGNSNIFQKLDTDSLDNLYMTGSFTGKADFNPGSDTFFLSTIYTVVDIYIFKLDKNGDFQWAVQLAGSSNSQARGIAVSKRGNIFTIGNFKDSIDYDPGIGKTYSLSKKGGSFLHKMSRCQTGSALDYAACNSFSIGRFTYSKTGKYKPFFTDIYGCDSIIDLNLDITSLSDSVSKVGSSLIYSSTATTYQWVKCPLYSFISGATGKSFTPSSSGSYALIVTKGICKDTSKCISVIPVNISENNRAIELTLSPNPTNGLFYIQTDDQTIGATINIYNVLGQKVKSFLINQILTTEVLNPGIYFVEIINNEKRVLKKLIVN